MYKFVIHKFDHIWVSVIDNEYMFNVINFIKYKFDNETNANSIIMIGINYSEVIPEYRKLYPTKKLIVYNWEQLIGCIQWIHIPSLCESMRGADEIWDYNDLNTTYMKQFHNITVDKVYPFKYYPEIEKLTSKEDPEIDILFYGSLNQRRANIITSIWSNFYNKYKCIIMFGHRIEDNHRYIENSKIIVNLHAFEPWNRQEQERIGFLVGNKKCVVSELSQENYFGDAIVEVHIDQMCNAIRHILDNDAWKDVAENGYDRFKNDQCMKIVNG